MARGYIYEVSADPSLLGNICEEDFYGMLPDEVGHLEDVKGDILEETVRNEAGYLSKKGFSTGEKDGRVYVSVSEKARTEIFRGVNGKFHELAGKVTPEDFREYSALLWNISNVIRDRGGDLFYLNGVSYDFCGFLRRMLPDTEYYLGNAVLMY